LLSKHWSPIAICLCILHFSVMGNIHKISLQIHLSTTLPCLLAGHVQLFTCILIHLQLKNLTSILPEKPVSCVAHLNSCLINVWWNVSPYENMFKIQSLALWSIQLLDFWCWVASIHSPFNSNCHPCICLLFALVHVIQ
jgi:hypothetical protein